MMLIFYKWEKCFFMQKSWMNIKIPNIMHDLFSTSKYTCVFKRVTNYYKMKM